MTQLSTLCYLERDGKYLMLHRTMKKNDVNKDKWIGVGGHFEADESPEECLLREVWEETGYTLTAYRYRGIVTFVSGDGVTEYMSLFTADGFTGQQQPCEEGQLEWVDKQDVWKLNIWEGDKIFFRLLEETKEFFSLKLVYDGTGVLVSAALNGKSMELFDVLTREGVRTGIVRERGVAHRDGSPHATSHVWAIRENDRSGYDLLLQKRSKGKDSNPGCYDISAAGHVAAGDDYPATALRELWEELGIRTDLAKLRFVGIHRGGFEQVFYEKPFRDYEISAVYIYQEPIDENELCLQQSEVEAVRWMDYRECEEMVKCGSLPNCIYEDELLLVGRFLGLV
ncbi:MAG: NUDIX domain-containing protein [Lachnospiraceae bacterium]|jgi:8-oxo-dGTP diphosphatase|nr:NUDIX domain-containing protein [Lachnospiraceae bacterium]